jgi:hypothetical protein
MTRPCWFSQEPMLRPVSTTCRESGSGSRSARNLMLLVSRPSAHNHHDAMYEQCWVQPGANVAPPAGQPQQKQMQGYQDCQCVCLPPCKARAVLVQPGANVAARLYNLQRKWQQHHKCQKHGVICVTTICARPAVHNYAMRELSQSSAGSARSQCCGPSLQPAGQPQQQQKTKHQDCPYIRLPPCMRRPSCSARAAAIGP